MKAKIIVIGIALVALTLGSCNKDYVCECTTTSTAAGDKVQEDVESYYLANTSKSEAESACTVRNDSQAKLSTPTQKKETTCSLK